MISHFTIKASKVDETRIGKVSWFLVINTEEEVQGEGGDHGGEELQITKNNNFKSQKKRKGRGEVQIML